ncbi:MAG: C40 family peptidase [Leptospiraceae bacterium]|nr:C40 family peptidase [Leptospiraceae bacterium]MCP5495017.1 C40 family peptidase [Leptospiraceae bacterium]
MKSFFFILFLLAVAILPLFAKGGRLSKKEKIRLIKAVRWISQFDIKYGSAWTPPKEEESMRMDCSNTARYLYKIALGIHLPRSSYDQYIEMRDKNRFFPAPVAEDSVLIDTEKLKKKLKTGDLLFWVNTYNVPKDRNPPISHVMIYLGRTKKGNIMKMGGSNTFGKGDTTKVNGGPDIYSFDPNKFMGCVRGKNRECVINSSFYGYGRPY